MKRSLFRIIAFALCAFLLMFSIGAFAESTGDPSGEKDFGDFAGDSDYGYDPGPDTGSDWGGSSDWGDDHDNGGYILMPIGGSTEMGSCSGQDMMMVLIIILIIMLVLWFLSRRTQTPVTTTVQRTDDSMLTPMDTYVNTVDPNFSIVDMQKRFANLYVQLQDCWCAKNLEPLRPYLTDELYSQSDRQLDEMRKNYQTPHVERIAVLGTNIRGYFQRDGMDHLIVEMSTRINTYVTDDTNGGIVRGDPNSEKFMTYEWDVCRPTGVKTGEEAPVTVVNCPNCGAPVSINATAQCPYCGSVITVRPNDWVLASIKGLSQRTNTL